MAGTAVRVFGTPITHGTRAQRALAAKNNQNAGGKLDQVLLLSSQSQKAAVGGGNVSALCTTFGRVYNATGETMTYVTEHNWEGNFVRDHPVIIQNGQWVVFTHAGHKGSVAALVYRIEDCCDSMISWNNPRKTSSGETNTAYCEMNDPGYFDDCDWDAIYKKLLTSGTESKATKDGYSTQVNIDARGNSPSFTALFYLDV